MTTVENNSPETAPQGGSAKGVLCAKCEHLNPPGSTSCEFCRAELFRICPKCGQRFQDALSRCSHCGERMHRHGTRRRRKQSDAGPNNLYWACAAVLILALAVAYKVFQKVGGMQFGQ
jgi:hypothetical protein